MVERSLSMREVPGSIPGASIQIFLLTDFFACFVCIKKVLIVSNVDTKYEFWKDCRALFLYFAVNKSRLMLGMNIANNKDTQVKNAKKMSVCNVRESNPGRPRGRRAFYHWTNDAYMTVGRNFEFKRTFFTQSIPCFLYIFWFAKNSLITINHIKRYNAFNLAVVLPNSLRTHFTLN